MHKKLAARLLAAGCAAALFTGCAGPERGDGSSSSASVVSSSSTADGSDGEALAPYRKITAEEAKRMLDDDSAVVVVDVRTQEEYDAGHIEGAVLVPNESIGDTPPEQLSDLDAVLLVYCRTGVRSKQASEKLLALGYSQVYDFGGIADWPYGTVTEAS